MWVVQKVLASPRKKNIAEHYFCDNTLILLIELEKSELVFSSFIRSGRVWQQKKCSAMPFFNDSCMYIYIYIYINTNYIINTNNLHTIIYIYIYIYIYIQESFNYIYIYIYIKLADNSQR